MPYNSKEQRDLPPLIGAALKQISIPEDVIKMSESESETNLGKSIKQKLTEYNAEICFRCLTECIKMKTPNKKAGFFKSEAPRLEDPEISNLSKEFPTGVGFGEENIKAMWEMEVLRKNENGVDKELLETRNEWQKEALLEALGNMSLKEQSELVKTLFTKTSQLMVNSAKGSLSDYDRRDNLNSLSAEGLLMDKQYLRYAQYWKFLKQDKGSEQDNHIWNTDAIVRVQKINKTLQGGDPLTDPFKIIEERFHGPGQSTFQRRQFEENKQTINTTIGGKAHRVEGLVGYGELRRFMSKEAIKKSFTAYKTGKGIKEFTDILDKNDLFGEDTQKEISSWSTTVNKFSDLYLVQGGTKKPINEKGFVELLQGIGEAERDLYKKESPTEIARSLKVIQDHVNELDKKTKDKDSGYFLDENGQKVDPKDLCTKILKKFIPVHLLKVKANSRSWSDEAGSLDSKRSLLEIRTKFNRLNQEKNNPNILNASFDEAIESCIGKTYTVGREKTEGLGSVDNLGNVAWGGLPEDNNRTKVTGDETLAWMTALNSARAAHAKHEIINIVEIVSTGMNAIIEEKEKHTWKKTSKTRHRDAKNKINTTKNLALYWLQQDNSLPDNYRSSLIDLVTEIKNSIMGAEKRKLNRENINKLEALLIELPNAKNAQEIENLLLNNLVPAIQVYYKQIKSGELDKKREELDKGRELDISKIMKKDDQVSPQSQTGDTKKTMESTGSVTDNTQTEYTEGDAEQGNAETQVGVTEGETTNTNSKKDMEKPGSNTCEVQTEYLENENRNGPRKKTDYETFLQERKERAVKHAKLRQQYTIIGREKMEAKEETVEKLTVNKLTKEIALHILDSVNLKCEAQGVISRTLGKHQQELESAIDISKITNNNCNNGTQLSDESIKQFVNKVKSHLETHNSQVKNKEEITDLLNRLDSKSDPLEKLNTLREVASSYHQAVCPEPPSSQKNTGCKEEEPPQGNP